jgi:hypothetical protein
LEGIENEENSPLMFFFSCFWICSKKAMLGSFDGFVERMAQVLMS